MFGAAVKVAPLSVSQCSQPSGDAANAAVGACHAVAPSSALTIAKLSPMS